MTPHARNAVAQTTSIDICNDPETMAQRAAAAIGEALGAARTQRGVAHIALSGGTTPVRTYQLLARHPDGLDGVELWFADERCVGPRDADSNYRLARETLIEPARVPRTAVHRMEGERGPHSGARRYAEHLRTRLAPDGEGDVPTLDLAVLGIGPDGHIASLFPNHTALEAPPDVPCLGLTDSPKPPPERITLTLPVLCAARSCLLLASGEGKAQALADACGKPTPGAPASLLARERLHVIADRAAAVLLRAEGLG
ncbi:MAG: 6-phosphogluconolactonase [Solirubrobacteraceae bacterium]